MLSYKQYKVLKAINEIEEIDSSTFISELKIEAYELNEILLYLDSQGYICNLFNDYSESIKGTEITDIGKIAVNNYIKNLIKYIFKNYIWVILTIFITALLTGYFTAIFTR